MVQDLCLQIRRTDLKRLPAILLYQDSVSDTSYTSQNLLYNRLMKEIANWRMNKKVRLYIIGGLLILVAVLAFFFEGLRLWMLGIGIVLLVALGFEAGNTDIDLGSVIGGESFSDSVIERDDEGNLEQAADGGLLTRLLRDKEGNVVAAGTSGAKYTDEYNCDDFDTQPEAQQFFEKAGGVTADVNRLDGNKDGVACQALPAGAN